MLTQGWLGPGGVPQVMALQTQLANGAHVGDDNSDICKLVTLSGFICCPSR